MGEQRGTCQSAFMDPSEEAKLKLAVEIEDATDNAAAPFESKFAPSDMRQLALVAHNHMKPAMKEFIETYCEFCCIAGLLCVLYGACDMLV